MSEPKYKLTVDVPKTEPGAYNPDRKISALIQNQVKHLKAAEEKLPESQRTHIDISGIETELQASEYIRKVTALLHRTKAADRKT